MPAPKVFVSYSHDSQGHKDWVRRLAEDLRANGVDATLDQWDLHPGQDVVAFMQHGIADADRVVMVCSAPYVEKAEAGVGGVGYERLIVTAEVVQSIDTKKFIPIVRAGTNPPRTPNFLGFRFFVNFESDAEYQSKLEELLREIHGAPALAKPPLGANPFSGELEKETATSRTIGPTGFTAGGTDVLSDMWFVAQQEQAEKGLSQLQLTGCMELRFALHSSIAKSQIDLLGAVRKSEITTFGWPIGVLLESREEYRPRPYGDGIRAEVLAKEHQSYDYWAARTNGDYYLLQSLFEDTRAKDVLFFNTRIVRVTEALLFASNLYSNLGVPAESKLSIRVTHRGLAGRTLASSNPNRWLSLARKAHEASSESEVVVVLGTMRDTLVEDVQRLTEPLFMLFDFQQFERSVYENIVRKFEQGQVT